MFTLPIKIDRIENFSCVDQIINALARWADLDYELMFLDEWQFNYLNQDFMFTERLQYSDENKYKLLKKYHSIDIVCEQLTDKDKDAAFNFIKESVKKNIPVGIIFDNYWMPWHFSNYKKRNVLHYLLVIGVDEENDEVICIDSQMAVDGQKLDRYHFCNGCIEYNLFVFNKKNNEIGLKDIINEMCARTFNNETKSVMFKNIKEFGLDFLKDFDYEAEYDLYKNNPNNSRFLNEITQIGNSRANYARALCYINKKYNYCKLENPIENLKICCSKWKIIFGILIKSYYTNSFEEVRYKIFNKILEISYFEEQTFNEINYLLENGEEKNFIVKNTEYNHFNGPIKHIKHIDLSIYFNNKGICFENNIFSEAQLSNPNRFIIIDKLTNNILEIENMKFDFGYIDKKLDNISCNGQEILIGNCNYKYIMFLACSEFADCCDVLKIVYENEKVEKIEFKSSSWMRKKSQFDEVLAMHGIGALRIENEINKYPFKVGLFAKCYKLNESGKIMKIILPQLTNMHIFAISLGN